MRNLAYVLTCLLAACALAGCGVGIRGQWSLVRAQPNADTFAIDDARFGDDKQFEATITIEGRTRRETGSYKFNGSRLTLRPVGGGMRTFDASVTLGQLVIREGDDRKAILKKAK